MAKTSSIVKNNKRFDLALKEQNVRQSLKKTIMDKLTPLPLRIASTIKLSERPRNGSKDRFVNRCKHTGRTGGVYKKFGLCRISIREFALQGLLPGVTKGSLKS